MKNYTIRKGLYLMATGTANRIYQIRKTTRRYAELIALESGKSFRIERRKLFIYTKAIGHKSPTH